MINLENLQLVWLAANSAVTKLEVGDEFLGAYGEAEKAGYVKGTLEYNLFVSMYLDALDVAELRIYVGDCSGLITKLD